MMPRQEVALGLRFCGGLGFEDEICETLGTSGMGD